MTSHNIKLGISPIAWNNDDMHELGADISFEQCIYEMAKAGYQGCEVGHKFPRDPVILREALSRCQLTIASAWYSLYFTEEGREQETIEGFVRHMQFLKAMDAKVIVVCECGHSIHCADQPVFEQSPVFSQQAWEKLIEGLHDIGQLAKENDMTIVYHHHMGTGIENEEEISRLMHETNPEIVSLLMDTGHLACAGANIIELLQTHGHRIRHVHLKDIRHDILQLAKQNHLSFLKAIKTGVFTVPGDGGINFTPIFDMLTQLGYQGWIIVEAEQDPKIANPLTYAIKAREFMDLSLQSLRGDMIAVT